jgi:hypothetical protein
MGELEGERDEEERGGADVLIHVEFHEGRDGEECEPWTWARCSPRRPSYDGFCGYVVCMGWINMSTVGIGDVSAGIRGGRSLRKDAP